MLVLTRKPGEALVITLEDGREIEIVIAEIRRNQVRLKVYAATSIKVNRLEVARRMATQLTEEAAS